MHPAHRALHAPMHPHSLPIPHAYTHTPMYPTPCVPHAPHTPCTPCTHAPPFTPYTPRIYSHTPGTLRTHMPCTPHTAYTSYTPYTLLLEHLPQESKQPDPLQVFIQRPPPQGGLPGHPAWRCPAQGSALPSRPQSTCFFSAWATVCPPRSLSALGEGLAFLCILSVRIVPGTWLGFGSVWRG